MEKVKYKNVNEYIKGFPKNVKELLKQIRTTIKEIVPEAEESISYGMPAYKLKGKPVVYFAAFNNHIGFYATPKELIKYKQGKGSIQFPIDEPLPLELISKIAKFKVKD